jgi:hypothetical protein
MFVLVFPCAGTGVATGRSPIQGVIRNAEKQGSETLRGSLGSPESHREIKEERQKNRRKRQIKNYGALQYTIFSTLLSLLSSYVEIFSSISCSQSVIRRQ